MPGLVRLADAKLAEIGGGPPARRAGAAAARRRGRGAGAASAVFVRARGRILGGHPRAARTFRLKDSLGLQYLVRLLEAPGREIHVLDLTGERAGRRGA